MKRDKYHLLCLGFGLSAQTLCRHLDRNEWQITATSRNADGLSRITEQGCRGVLFDSLTISDSGYTHILVSIPPDADGDPVLRQLGPDDLKTMKQLQWLGYLSTTGVYGNHAGEWITEDTPLAPTIERAITRMNVEQNWQRLLVEHGVPVHLFRLAGIYGEGRNAIVSLRQGKARRVIKPGQIFSRIHADDIAGIIMASMSRPNPGAAYNCADDEPCPPQDVIAYAAQLLGIEPPPEEDFDTADLSTMARSFYADCKRVSNKRVKEELGYHFKYPNYRVGLESLAQNDWPSDRTASAKAAS